MNRSWMCDAGRLLAPVVEGGERVQEPQVESRSADWDQAISEAVSRLRHAGGKVAAVINPWSTLEEGWLALKILAALGAGPPVVAIPEHVQGKDDDLLIRADKSPNHRGLTELLAAAGGTSRSLDDLLAQAAAGDVRTLLVLGEDLVAMADEARLDAALTAGMELLVLASHVSSTTAKATVVMPAGIFPEVDGTVMNFQGRVQVMRAAYPPPFLARTAVKILNGLAAALDAGNEDLRPRDLFDQMAGEIPAFAGLTFSGLGGMGRPLPAAASAGSGA